MRIMIPMWVLFVTVQPLYAQTTVDTLVSALDSLAVLSLDEWRMSPDLKALKMMKGDPTAPDFDDSQWEILRLRQSVYPDSCWLRAAIALPERMLGQPLRGRVRFLVSLDDYGYLWVNGSSLGHFPWDGEFTLSDDAQPGQRFVLAIKAVNTGGPLRLLRAEITCDELAALRQEIQDFGLSLKVGQKLLSFDTYQTNARAREDPGTDKSKTDKNEKQRLNVLLQSLAKQVDVGSLKTGGTEAFKRSLESVRSQLTPIKEFCRKFTLYFDANAHIDAAWLWREKETIDVCKNTFASVLNMMNQRPDFTYTQSSAAYYDWMERLYPDLFRDIGRRIKEHRWEVIGGMWVEPDCNIPSGESWARQLLYAKRYFKEKFGVDVAIGWNPDSFGYNWNMPEFYQNAGIDAFITQKIGWNETNVFPYRLFWWESPNGSRILSYFPFDYVNTVDDPFLLVDWVRQFEANTGMKKLMVLFGVGDHGGGPSLQMLERIDRLSKLDIYPSIEFGTAFQYLNWVKQQDLSSLPIWGDELYLEYHQGTFTTQAKMKELNRRSEVLLTNAEKLSTIASGYGMTVGKADLQEAWKKTLFNQFHDILPGSGIREVYIDASESYDGVRSIGTHELNRALSTIIGAINTSRLPKGMPVLVFNTLSWDRTDLVTVDLPEGDMSEYAVYDRLGKEVVSQMVQRDRYHEQVLFVGRDVPSFGYTCYELRKRQSQIPGEVLQISEDGLENGIFRIVVDKQSGWVKSLIDKRNGREVLAGVGNELQLLEDLPSAWDAWNLGWTGVKFPLTYRRAEVIEKGPVRLKLRLYHDFLKPGTKKDFPTEDFPNSFFAQDIILYRDLARIDFVTNVDWWESKTMLKVAFPLAFSDTVATYEIPFGSIKRSTQMRTSWERAKQEVPAQRWADVSTGGYGVSLLNRQKYGYDIKGNVIRLSLLRSPKWPDPAADRGKHSIEYTLYPHQGDWRDALTVQRGLEYNNPLISVLSNNHKGQLPDTHSFLRLTPSNLILSTVKFAEEGDAWVVQWYDALGRESTATLEFDAAPKRASMSNFLEEEGEAIPVRGRSVVVLTKASSVKTVKVHF